MIIGQARQRHLLLASVFLLGSIFIMVTRVRPATAGGRQLAPAAPPQAAPLPNHLAPDFTLSGLDGTPVRLAELRGQVVLINVWATWCPPCRAEMPAIQAVYDRYRDQGFQVLAVDLGEDREVVAAFMRERGLTFSALLDREGEVANLYRSSVLPSSFFVDRLGVIRAVYRGPMPRGVIAGTVEQLLKETG